MAGMTLLGKHGDEAVASERGQDVLRARPLPAG
jgi:hypothetical protein